MSDFHFVVERPGIHTTFQDSGYEHLQHFGITTGGVVDNNLFNYFNHWLFFFSLFFIIRNVIFFSY